MTKNRWVFRPVTLLLLFAAVQLGGCSSSTQYGAVHFKTIPPGAEVMNLKDDTNLGMTPVLVTWQGDPDEPEYVTVEITKKGYQNDITSFWVKMRHKTREEAAAAPHPITIDLKKRK